MTERSAEARDRTRRHLPIASAGLHRDDPELDSGVRVSEPPRDPVLGVLPGGVGAFAALADPYPMGPTTLRAFRALIAAVCPPSPAPQPADMTRRVEEGARRFIAYMHPAIARLMAICIVLLDLMPLFSFRERKRLCGLDIDRARAFLERVARCRFLVLRTLLAGLRGLVLSVYFDQREVHSAIGYHPAPFIRERIAFRTARLATAARALK